MAKRNAGARLEWRDDRKVWEIIWYERGARKRKSTGTDNRTEADQQLAAHLTAEPAGFVRPRDPSERLIADVLNAYATGRGSDVADPERLGYAVMALLPFWGELRVGDVTETLCKGYSRQRRKANETVRRELSTLRAAINFDVAHGQLTRTVPVWLPSPGEHKDRWLTRSDAGALLRAARSEPRSRRHLPLFILLGLYAAARKEAILSLRWPQVDLARGLIDLNPPGRGRTEKGRPIIPIPRRLVTFLKCAQRHGTSVGHVITFHGKPVLDIKKSFAAACVAAGLEDVTPHTLRHTAATWMAQAGVPMMMVSRYLGHTDTRTTERIYAHHAPEYLAPATAALDRRR
jgi:integrase